MLIVRALLGARYDGNKGDSVSKEKSKTRKEAFFVQVESVDKTPYFVDVSKDMGKPMQFTKPLATVAMRVTDDAVLFSVLKTSAKMRAALAANPLSLPLGPLSRLDRKASAVKDKVTPGHIVVEYEDTVKTFTINVDPNGIASLDYPAGEDDLVFELPKRQLQLTIVMPGPKDRTLAVSWTGFQNKPGSSETLLRASAYALNHLTALAEFSIITGFQKVNVPAPPGRTTVVRPKRSSSDQVMFNVPVRLWTDAAAPTNIARGSVAVTVSLDNANAVTGRAMLEMEPSPDIAEVFESYRPVLDNAIQNAMQDHLGPSEMTGIMCDIVLGDLGQGQIERLRESVSSITGYDLNTRQSVPIRS